MDRQRYVVMGAGEVGYYLAQTLSRQGHEVVVIESDPQRAEEVEDELDATVIAGNGAHIPILEAARVDSCDLFMAVSAHDETNLAATLLAKSLGATRAVTRVAVAEDVTTYHRLYERLFQTDLIMSTQLLATTRILNYILGHNTVQVEYLARDKLQVRRIRLEEDSPLVRTALRNLQMPEGSLVVAYFRGDELTVPAGDDRAEPGDHALVLGKTEVIEAVEAFANPNSQRPSKVVIAGGGETGRTLALALAKKVSKIQLIEWNRSRAEELAAALPDCSITLGDATDQSLLETEAVGDASAFVATTGYDETNLMASLLAKEMGVPEVIAMVDRAQTTYLWRKLGLLHIVSPRTLVHERIEGYIQGGYNANIVSLERGAAQVIERDIHAASPTAGASLAEMQLPRGLIVGAVIRGDRVFVPRGDTRIEVGDRVILFVEEAEVPLLTLFFPGSEEE